MMILLSNKHYIAKGSNRKCYQHPKNKNLCIKIMHTNKQPFWLREEIIYCRRIQKQHQEYSLNFYAKYHGTIKTNLGTGYVYDLLRDDDGMISLTLKYYLRSNKDIFSMEELINSWLKLKQNMDRYIVFSGDLNADNILINVKNNAINSVIVDGLGIRRWGNFIYLMGYFKPIARYIINETNSRFIHDEFLYIYSDVGIKHNIGLDFINGHSKTKVPLKTANDFYLSTIEKNTIHCNNADIWKCFRKNIRNNINILTYDFERVHPLLLIYYLRYKLKNLFKK